MGFYRSNDLTNSVKTPKGDRFLRIRRQSHQAHPTVLRIIWHTVWKINKKYTKYTNINTNEKKNRQELLHMYKMACIHTGMYWSDRTDRKYLWPLSLMRSFWQLYTRTTHPNTPQCYLLSALKTASVDDKQPYKHTDTQRDKHRDSFDQLYYKLSQLSEKPSWQYGRLNYKHGEWVVS